MSSHTHQDVQNIIAASKRLNEMRDELESFIGIIRGFIDLGKYADRGRYSILEISSMAQTARIDKRHLLQLRIGAYAGKADIRFGFVLSQYGKELSRLLSREIISTIRREDIRLFYDAMPTMLDLLTSAFPDLKDRISEHLKLAGIGDGLEICNATETSEQAKKA